MRICLLFIAMFLVTPIWASTFSGKIKSIMTGPNNSYDGKAFIKVHGEVDQSGGCHTNTSYNYVFDASTTGGKVTLSVLLSAFAAGKTVFIEGKGNNSCGNYYNIEDVNAIVVADQ